MQAPLKRLMIVAGHDPSGAGIDADCASIAELAIEPVSVLTARTDQDDRGMRSLGAREPSHWLAQALERSFPRIDALKFGLLPGAEHLRAARELVGRLRERMPALPIVVDPLIAASSGARFLDDDAVCVLRDELAREPVILTPNLDELSALTGVALETLQRSPRARVEAAHVLLERGASAVIVKGGHGSEDPVRDLLATREREAWVEHVRVPGGKIRGSGCRFASRLAGHLALGATLEESVRDAARHVAGEIARNSRR